MKNSGYDVKFLYNFDTIGNEDTTGIVDATGKKNFKYSVEVKKGEDTFTSEWVDVKVVNSDVAVEVTKAGLVAGDKAWGLGYITETDENVKLASVEAKNEEGTLVDKEFLPIFEKATSSDFAVAYAKADGTIVPVAPGKATFTVTFKNIEKTVTIPVEVKAAQEATSLVEKNSTLKVKAGQESTFNINVQDQFGEQLRTSDVQLKVQVTNSKGDEVVASEPKANAGKASVAVNLAKGEYTVKVSAGKKELGTLKLAAVDLSTIDADKYELKLAEDAKLDLYDEINNGEASTAKVSIKASQDGVNLTDEDFAELVKTTKLYVKSSDADIVSVTTEQLNQPEFVVTAGKKAGTATVTLYKKEGSYPTNLETVTVTVENTTPQINNLTFKSGVNAVEFKDAAPSKQEVANALSLKDKDGKEIFSDSMIEKVVYSEYDEQVAVYIKAVYGGKVFKFTAVKAEGEQPGNGGEQPGNGGEQPGNGGEQPGNGGEQPGNGGEQPGNGGEQPGNGGEQPGNGGEQPGNGGEQPGNGGEQPGNGGEQPGNGGEQPGNGGEQPGNGGEQPGNGGEQPGN
ncbi:proline-rich domain-containing protein, partial [Brevibacillus borstelensis]|uniref:proline-rich domain-containing protein n=1 Tax=Brevibacillus borstelensis TaxID=45462 RepID=UPI00203AA29C